MHARQPLPRLWLMTDERLGPGLLDIVSRLPAGSGVVFRHYSLPLPDRRRLFDKVRAIARRRRIPVLLGGSPALAMAWRADGSHGATKGKVGPAHLLRSAAVHDLRELHRAARYGANFIFVSPVFATRSHPGAPTLGVSGFRRLARRSSVPVIALGGVNAKVMRRVGPLAYGWAGIDAFA